MVAMVVLLPVPAKPVSNTGCLLAMQSRIVSNASCCLLVSFILLAFITGSHSGSEAAVSE